MDFLALLQSFVTSQPRESADIVVWLQGDQLDRAKITLDCYQKKLAPKIIIAGNNKLVGEGPRPGEQNISLTDMHKWLVDNGVPARDTITLDNAMHTGDQAKLVIDLTKKEKWKSLILVGSTHHQLRAFLTFLKYSVDSNWNGKIINQPYSINHDKIPSGRDKTVDEIFADEIFKIQKYKDHVASVKDGLEYFENTFAPDKLVVRVASTIEDAKNLFEWRNDPTTYQHFLTPGPISWECHMDWFKKVIDNQKRQLYIISEGEKKIGQVRFDIKCNTAEISITIAKIFRGKGFGKKTLDCSIKIFKKDHPEIVNIIAKIKPTNTSSLILFKNQGFQKVSEENNIITLNYIISH